MGIPHEVDPAQGGLAVAFEFADDRAGVQMIASGEPQQLREYAKMNTVLGVPVDNRVHGAVDMQQQTVVPTPVRETRIGTPASGDVIVHDNARPQCFGVFCAFVHLLRRRSGHVEVVAFLSSSLCFCFVHRLP